MIISLLINLTAALLTNGVHGAMRCHHDIKMRNRDAYTGNDYTLYTEYYGYYKRQPGKINGHSWYKSNTGRSNGWPKGGHQADDLAIWRLRDGGWAVGRESRKGSNICVFSTRNSHGCPYGGGFTQTRSLSWKYYKPTTREWKNSGMFISDNLT